jgi:GT2 family glycosyltransferase
LKIKFILQLSVIIVNYNVRYYLEHCLVSVQQACAGINAEVIVVDNASHDDSQSTLPDLFPKVTFIWNSENLGFSKACNIGLAQSSGDYILFLNPDTLLSEESLRICLRFFDEHKDCCGLGVKMVDGKGSFLRESKRLFPNPARSFWKLIGMSKLFPQSAIFSSYYASNIEEDQTAPVEVLSGAFMMISRKLLPRVNGFDEAFFMYAEDIDLSYRLMKTGFRNFYLPETTVIHFKGESTQKTEATYIRNFYGAMKLFVKKHYGGLWHTKWILIPAITTSAALANFKRIMRNRWVTIFRGNKKTNSSLLIVGSENSFNEMVHLIKYAQQTYTISGRAALNEQDDSPASCLLTNIHEYTKLNAVDAILFSGKDCTYTLMMETMRRLGPKFQYLFHSINTNSIIGESVVISHQSALAQSNTTESSQESIG